MSLFEVFQQLGDAGRGAIATGVDNFVAARVVTAIVDDDLPALTHLIRRFPECLSVDVLDGGTRALHVAADVGTPRTLKALLDAGGDVHCVNSFGRTALHIAAERRNGGIDVVQLLLAAGADLRARDILNQTPLHAASKSLNAEVLDFLGKQGADVDARDSFDQTALHLCAVAPAADELESGHAVAADVAARLLALGANPAAVDARRETPLHAAASQPRRSQTIARVGAEVVEVLLQENFPELPMFVAVRSATRSTALEMAVRCGNAAAVAALLRVGAGHLSMRRSQRRGEVVSQEFKLAVQNALDGAAHAHAGEILDYFLASGYDLLCSREILKTIEGVSSIAASIVHRGPPSLQAMCRARIRATLGAESVIAVDTLPITWQCKNLLVYNQPVLVPAVRAKHLRMERRVGQ